VFLGSQIRKIIKYRASEETSSEVERGAWEGFRAATRISSETLRQKIISHLLENFTMPTKSLVSNCHIYFLGLHL
jgi:hypothetical protein